MAAIADHTQNNRRVIRSKKGRYGCGVHGRAMLTMTTCKPNNVVIKEHDTAE